jgi:hypothetical protein
MNKVIYLSSSEAARLAAMQADQDRLGWLKQVEDFMTASGARALLEHVTPSEWLQHYAANEDAYSAVVAELERVD